MGFLARTSLWGKYSIGNSFSTESMSAEQPLGVPSDVQISFCLEMASHKGNKGVKFDAILERGLFAEALDFELNIAPHMKMETGEAEKKEECFVCSDVFQECVLWTRDVQVPELVM